MIRHSYNLLNNFRGVRRFSSADVPKSVEHLLVGSGVMGSSTAYFLATKIKAAGGNPSAIAVLEKDFSFTKTATGRSAASIRHQFSTKENIQISQFGSEFFRDCDKHLRVDGGDRVELGFNEAGYLFLASTSEQEVILKENHKLQTDLGSDISLLSTADLETRFPWLNCQVDDEGKNGIVAGCYGESGEGWLDAHGLMTAFRKKAQSLGVQFIKAELINVNTTQTNRVDSVDVCLAADSSTQTITCSNLINTAGAFGPKVAQMVSPSCIIPVSARRRCVFVLDCRELNQEIPLTVDITGVWTRSEGDLYLCGVSPPEDEDPEVDVDDFEVDHDLYYDIIWPALAQRVPAFEAVKVVNSWAGHYDMNSFDHNAIIGAHPVFQNFYYCNGFSGHGLQQSAGMGRGLSELILEGGFQTIDLSRFAFERVANNQPIVEKNVV